MSIYSPTTRDELIQYGFLKLGVPVIQVNIADEQAEACIDDALQYYQEFNQDSTERFYLAHQVTQADIDNGYITVPDNITSVINILPFGGESGIASGNFFTPEFQIKQDLFLNWNYSGLVSYELYGEYLSMLDIMFRTNRSFEFSRVQGRITLNTDWSKFTADESYLVFETTRAVDPTEFAKVYNDRWLKSYVVELMRAQWAQNLSKYKDVPLPGGVTVNADWLAEKAETAIAALKEEAKTVYQAPARFMIG